MSVVDNLMAAVAPSGLAHRRAKARSKMHDLGRECEWLRRVVDQHEQIEEAFDQLAAASDRVAARDGLRDLAVLLTGHAVAEEAVLYPALAAAHQKAHSMAAFGEHARIKIQLAALEVLEPATPPWREALQRLRDVLSEHLLDEECHWFPALARTGDAASQARLSARFIAEFDRYMGADRG